MSNCISLALKKLGCQECLTEDEDPLELELEDAYQRLMTHGIATFHKLQSQSDAQGNTFVSRPRLKPSSSIVGSKHPQISCSDICFAINQDSPGGLTAEALYRYWKRMHYGTDADSEMSYVMV